MRCPSAAAVVVPHSQLLCAIPSFIPILMHVLIHIHILIHIHMLDVLAWHLKQKANVDSV